MSEPAQPIYLVCKDGYKESIIDDFFAVTADDVAEIIRWYYRDMFGGIERVENIRVDFEKLKVFYRVVSDWNEEGYETESYLYRVLPPSTIPPTLKK